MNVHAPQVSPIFFTHIEQQRIQHDVFQKALRREIQLLSDRRHSLKDRILQPVMEIDYKVLVDSWLDRVLNDFRAKFEGGAYTPDLYLANGDPLCIEASQFHEQDIHTLIEDGDYRRPIDNLADRLLAILTLENLFGHRDTLEWLKSMRKPTGSLYEVTGVHLIVNLELNSDDGDNHEIFTPTRVDWTTDQCLWSMLQMANHYYLEVEGINARLAQLQGLLDSSQELRDLMAHIPDPSSPGSEPVTCEDGSSF